MSDNTEKVGEAMHERCLCDHSTDAICAQLLASLTREAGYKARIAELEKELDRITQSDRSKGNRLRQIADQYAVDCL